MSAVICPFLDNIPLIELGNSWVDVMKLLTPLKTLYATSTAVPSAYNIKIQRRLASTSPPIPAITLSFEEGLILLERLCSECYEASKIFLVLETGSPANIMVRLNNTSRAYEYEYYELSSNFNRLWSFG